MKSLSLPSLLKTAYNKQYISNYTGGGFVLTNHNVIYTDFRYTEQARLQSPNFEVISYTAQNMWEIILNDLKQRNITTLGVELGELCAANYLILTDAGFFPVDTSHEISSMRSIKTPEEIDCISRACKIQDAAFSHILTYLKPGVKEREIAAELEYFMKKQGADGTSFESIVASGKNSSMPHACVSSRELAPGDLVVMDFGCKVNGYCGDITRTVAIEYIAKDAKTVYNICYEAQMLALEAVKPGVLACDADKVARDIITKYGYGHCFGHGLGHAVGLQIHESPRLATTDSTVLAPGMAVTVEPGIYIANKFGVRIEDTVLILQNGCQRLTESSKELIIV